MTLLDRARKSFGRWFVLIPVPLIIGFPAVGQKAVVSAPPVSYTHLDVYKRQLEDTVPDSTRAALRYDREFFFVRSLEVNANNHVCLLM